MELLSVVAAAAAAYAFGSVWYMSLAQRWIVAAGIEVGPDGKPANFSARPFVVSGLALLVVAGMMRHMFGMAAIDGLGEGLVAGFGLGAFIVLPWIVTNHAYGGKPRDLTLIDGGYAVIGCTIIGTVLALF